VTKNGEGRMLAEFCRNAKEMTAACEIVDCRATCLTQGWGFFIKFGDLSLAKDAGGFCDHANQVFAIMQRSPIGMSFVLFFSILITIQPSE
jgi:hypothetical protein